MFFHGKVVRYNLNGLALYQKELAINSTAIKYPTNSNFICTYTNGCINNAHLTCLFFTMQKVSYVLHCCVKGRTFDKLTTENLHIGKKGHYVTLKCYIT